MTDPATRADEFLRAAWKAVRAERWCVAGLFFAVAGATFEEILDMQRAERAYRRAANAYTRQADGLSSAKRIQKH